MQELEIGNAEMRVLNAGEVEDVSGGLVIAAGTAILICGGAFVAGVVVAYGLYKLAEYVMD